MGNASYETGNSVSNLSYLSEKFIFSDMAFI